MKNWQLIVQFLCMFAIFTVPTVWLILTDSALSNVIGWVLFSLFVLGPMFYMTCGIILYRIRLKATDRYLKFGKIVMIEDDGDKFPVWIDRLDKHYFQIKSQGDDNQRIKLKCKYEVNENEYVWKGEVGLFYKDQLTQVIKTY